MLEINHGGARKDAVYFLASRDCLDSLIFRVRRGGLMVCGLDCGSNVRGGKPVGGH